jgi:hypothetical protein
VPGSHNLWISSQLSRVELPGHEDEAAEAETNAGKTNFGSWAATDYRDERDVEHRTQAYYFDPYLFQPATS